MFCVLGCHSTYYSEAYFNDGQEQATHANIHFHNMNTNLEYGVPLRRSVRVADNNEDCRELIERKRALRSSTRLGVQSNVAIQSSSKDRPQHEGEKPTKYHNINRYQWHKNKADKRHNDRHLKNEDSAKDETNVTTRVHTRYISKQRVERKKRSKDIASSDKRYSMRTRSERKHSLRQKDSSSASDKGRSERRRMHEIETKQKSQNDKNGRERRVRFRKEERGKLEEVQKKEDVRIVEKSEKEKDSLVETSEKVIEKDIKSEKNLAQENSQNNIEEQNEEIEREDKEKKCSTEKSSPINLSPISSSESNEELETSGNSVTTLNSSIDVTAMKEGDTQVKQDEEQCSEDWVVISELSEKPARSNSTTTVDTDFGDDIRNSLKVIDEYFDEKISSDRSESDAASEPSEISDKIESVDDCSSNKDTIREQKDVVDGHNSESKPKDVNDTVVNEESDRFPVSHKLEAWRKDETMTDSQISGELNLNIDEKTDPNKENKSHELIKHSSSPQVVLDKVKFSVISSGEHSYLSSMHLSPVSSSGNESENERSHEINEKPTTVEKSKLMTKLRLRSIISNKYKTIRKKSIKKSLRICGSKFNKKNIDKSRGVRKRSRQHLKQSAKDSSEKHSSTTIAKVEQKTVVRFQSSYQFPRCSTGKKTLHNIMDSEASNIKQVEKDTYKKSADDSISENKRNNSHEFCSDLKELGLEVIPNTSKKSSHKAETTLQLSKPNKSESNKNNTSLVENNLTEKQFGIRSSDYQKVESIESKGKPHIDMEESKGIGKQLKHDTYIKESTELSSDKLNSYEIPNGSSQRNDSQRDGKSSDIEGVSTHESEENDQKNFVSPAHQKEKQVNNDQNKNGANYEQENNQPSNEPRLHLSSRVIVSSSDKCDKANDYVRQSDIGEAFENDYRLKAKSLSGNMESYDDIEESKIDTKHEIKTDTLLKPPIQTVGNDQSSPNERKSNVANKPLNKDNDKKRVNTTRPTQLTPIEKKHLNSADLIPGVSTLSYDCIQHPKTENRNCNLLSPNKSVSTAAQKETARKLNESPETADRALCKEKNSETSRKYLNDEGKETENPDVASEIGTQTKFKELVTKPKPSEKEVLTCRQKGDASNSIINTSEKSEDQSINKPTPKASEASRKTDISATKNLTKIDAAEILATAYKLSDKKQEIEKDCINTTEKSQNINEIFPATSKSSKNAEICTSDNTKTVSLKKVAVVTKALVEKQDTNYDEISTSGKSKDKTIKETPLISSDKNREIENPDSSDFVKISRLKTEPIKSKVLLKKSGFGKDGFDISEKSKQQSIIKMQPKLSESIEKTQNLTSSDLNKTTPLNSIAVNVKIHVGKQNISKDSSNTSEKVKEQSIIEIIPKPSDSNRKPENISAAVTEKSIHHCKSEVPSKASGLNRKMEHVTTTSSDQLAVGRESHIEDQSTSKDGPNIEVKSKEQTFSKTPQKFFGLKRKLEASSNADSGETIVTENAVLNCKLFVEKQQICKDSIPGKSNNQTMNSSGSKAVTETSTTDSPVKITPSESKTLRSEDSVKRPVSKQSLQLKTVSIIDRGLLSFIPQIASSASSNESTPEYVLPGITKVSAADPQFMNLENKTLNIKKVSEKKDSFLLIDRGIRGSSTVESDIKTSLTALKKGSPRKAEIIDRGKRSKNYGAAYASNSDFSKEFSSPQKSTKNLKENCNYTLTDFDFSAIREIFDKNPFLANSTGANGESQNKNASAGMEVPTTSCSSATVEDSNDSISVGRKSKRNSYPAMGVNENENIENEKPKQIHQAGRSNILAENIGDDTEPPKKVKKRVRFEGTVSDSEKPSSESDSSTKRSPNNHQTKEGSQRKTLVENISSVIHKNHEREILRKSSRLIERTGNNLEKSSKEYPNISKNLRSPNQHDGAAATNPNEISLIVPSSSKSQKSILTTKTSNQNNKTFASPVTSNINSSSSFAASLKNTSSIKTNISEAVSCNTTDSTKTIKETLNNTSFVSSSMQLPTTVPHSSQPLHSTIKPTFTHGHRSNSSSTNYSSMLNPTPPWLISYPHQSSHMYPMNQGR